MLPDLRKNRVWALFTIFKLTAKISKSEYLHERRIQSKYTEIIGYYD